MAIAETARTPLTRAATRPRPDRSRAVVLQAPGQIGVQSLLLNAPRPEDVVVDVRWSGVSTGTEKLLFSGEMPAFPGFGYPLVPGYEAVGDVAWAGSRSGCRRGERVFVPGASCFAEARGLFGASAERLVVPGARVQKLDADMGEQGVLLALAATAQHVYRVSCQRSGAPELIVGHGVLGRLLARLVLAHGEAAPTVWERESLRCADARGYQVTAAQTDRRDDYRSIVDVSGAAGLLDGLLGRLARGGEVVLGGFYAEPLQFQFPAAFMREARISVAAEWQPQDLAEALALVRSGRLALDGLITNRVPAEQASEAYPRAFADPTCLKLILDWSEHG